MPAVAQLHAPADLVAVEWIRTLPGLTADGVATQLPSDETTWAQNGFITVPGTVGGSPAANMPLRQPVCQVEAWATVPGSDKLPWGIANQLIEQVRAGTYDRTTFGRPLTISAGGLAFPAASVKSVTALTEPRRVWSDAGDFAGFTMDILLVYVAQGEIVQ